MNPVEMAGNLRTEHGRRIDIVFFLALIILILLSYGKVWERGGYADDFPFLILSSSHGYASCIVNWYYSISPRMSAALFTPLLMKIFNGAKPENFIWWPFHLTALVLFTATIVLYDRILNRFRVSWITRYLAVALLALFPIKYEILFWPSAILGHMVPIFMFFLASWLYLGYDEAKTAVCWRRVLALFLFVFAALSLENILPALAVIILVRPAVFPSSRKAVIAGLALVTVLGLVIFLVHHYVPLSAKGPVLFKYLLKDPAGIRIRIMDVIFSSLYRVVTYPLMLLNDRYYWGAIKNELFGVDFLFAACALTVIYLCFIARFDTAGASSADLPRHRWPPMIAGMAVWLLALSPFALVSYFLPNRAFFVPLAGLSLAFAAIADMSAGRIRMKRRKILFSAGATLMLAVFVLLDMHIQDRFHKIWKLEQKLMSAFAGLKGEVLPGTPVCIFNLPVFHEPGIRIDTTSTISGMAKWVFADNSISALPQANLTDTYSIPNGGLSGSGTVFNLSGDRKALFFCKGNFIPVDSLELFPAGMQKKEAADRCLAGSVRPISGKITYGDTCTVTVKDAVLFARPDCAVLRIAIKAEKNISGSRLIVHADYKDGRMVSYDKYLRADSGFRKKEGVYRKDLFIQDLSRLRSVSVYLSDKSGALSRESRTAGKRIVINF